LSVSFGQGALAEGLNAQMGVVERMLAAQVSFDDLQVDPATSHLAQAGGKRLRPLLVLLAAQLGPRPQDPAVYDAAVVVELTHLASLYHDDVMDEAPMRRGVPSAQAKFGNSVAILAGDVLDGQEVVVDVSPDGVLAGLSLTARGEAWAPSATSAA